MRKSHRPSPEQPARHQADPTGHLDDATYVVVGAGLAGAATAWQLARAGHDVVVVERGEPADAAGSSHGSARIFRYAYPSAFYTDLVVRARRAWDELEREHGQLLITPTGSFDFGSRRDPHLLARVMEGAGVEHELLSAAEASGRAGGIVFDSTVLWHPGAGVINAESSVWAMLDLARSAGARLLTGFDVVSVDRTGPVGYRISSRSGATLDAAGVVVAAGGWLPSLVGRLSLPAGFLADLPDLTVRQEQAFHFPYRESGVAGHPWPTVIHKSDDIQTYSLPGGRDADFRGQKVAEYCGGRSIGSAADQDGVVDPDNRSRVVAYVRERLPGLVPEPYAEATCLFTNTPTEDFLLDRAEGITLVSPCSGHGAKFAPLIGALAAEMASAPDDGAARETAIGEFLLTARRAAVTNVAR